MSQSRCIHDFLPGQCAICQVPEGLTPRVYITGGGEVFHRDPGCAALLAGQNKARSRRRRIHRPRQLPLVEARIKGRGACTWCFPKYRQR